MSKKDNAVRSRTIGRFRSALQIAGSIVMVLSVSGSIAISNGWNGIDAYTLIYFIVLATVFLLGSILLSVILARFGASSDPVTGDTVV